MAYNDYNLSFSEPLEMVNKSTIHIRNLKLPLTEIYKYLHGLSPPSINEVFQTNDCPYVWRNPRKLASNQKSAIKYDPDAIGFKGPQIWQIIILESPSLFKSNIKI